MIRRFGGRALLADDMGLGKSYQALMYFYQLRHKYEGRPAVVVCPAFLKWNWEDEVKKHLNLRAMVLEGMKVPKRMPRLKSQIVIVNYDILGPWLPYLKSLNPWLVIPDECHYAKNRSTHRTKHVQSLCKDVPKVLALGGTPLESRPVELWPILNIIRPDVFPSFRSFAERYCRPRRRPWGWEFRGATNTQELNEILTAACMIRRRKRDVLKDLPDKNRIVVPMELSEIGEYQNTEKNFKKWLLNSGVASKKKLRAIAIDKMGYLKRLAASMKLRYVISWIDNFLESSNEKIILYAIHKKIIKQLKDKYKDSCVVIDGSTPKKRRRMYVKQFNGDRKTRILIGQLDATGIGWSSTSATTVGFVEMGWIPGRHVQAEDRVYGIGRGVKGKSVFAYYFVAKDTIEERLCKLIQEHQSVVDTVLDGGKSTDLDIYNQLIGQYRRRAA